MFGQLQVAMGELKRLENWWMALSVWAAAGS